MVALMLKTETSVVISPALELFKSDQKSKTFSFELINVSARKNQIPNKTDKNL
jgi:hypothetical protein